MLAASWQFHCSSRSGRKLPPAVALDHESHLQGRGDRHARTPGCFQSLKREEQAYLQSYHFFQAQQRSLVLSVVEEGLGDLLGAAHSDAQLARWTFRPKCNTLAGKRGTGVDKEISGPIVLINVL